MPWGIIKSIFHRGGAEELRKTVHAGGVSYHILCTLIYCGPRPAASCSHTCPRYRLTVHNMYRITHTPRLKPFVSNLAKTENATMVISFVNKQPSKRKYLNKRVMHMKLQHISTQTFPRWICSSPKPSRMQFSSAIL